MNELAASVAVLGGQDLPVLRQTLEELRKLRKQEDRITGRDVSRVVLLDPMMTLHVLRYAESKRTPRQPTDITTVEHAVMMHGITSFFANFSKLKTIEEVLAGFPQALQGALGVISRAYQASIIAGNLAAARHDVESDEVIISALLHEMAEMLLWICMPEPAIRLQQLMDHSKGIRSASMQRVLLGYSLTELQLQLARTWKLPPLLMSLMDDEHAERPRVLNVSLAAGLARHTTHGWYDAAIPDDINGVRKLIGGSIDAAQKLVKHASIQAARKWKYFDVRPNAAWIPMEPGPWPDSNDAAQVAGNKPDADLMKRSLIVLKTPQSAKKPDPAWQDNGIAGLLYGIVNGAGLARAAYGKVNVAKRVVEFNHGLMNSGGLQYPELQFALGAPHLFARIMERMQGLWCNSSTRVKLLPHLPAPLDTQLANMDFFCMSIHDERGLPSAFIYADAGVASRPLDETRYALFKQLCMAAARQLHGVRVEPPVAVK